MSAIDQYKHHHIGFIECPSRFEIMNYNPLRLIAIYELLEDIPDDERDFDGKIGDILIGGGGGEVSAFRISVPEFFNVFTEENGFEFKQRDDIFKSFWSPTEAFALCDGFNQIGWSPDQIGIEWWLAENMFSLLIDNIEKYKYIKPLSDSVDYYPSKLKFVSREEFVSDYNDLL
jgi:hypothetical protein